MLKEKSHRKFSTRAGKKIDLKGDSYWIPRCFMFVLDHENQKFFTPFPLRDLIMKSTWRNKTR